MQKQEFEERVGYTVTDEEYRVIEYLYMRAGNMDKDEFCQDYKKHKDSKLLAQFIESENTFRVAYRSVNKEKNEAANLLIAIANERDDKRARDMAIKLVGKREYIKAVLRNECELSSADKEILLSLI